MISTFVALFGVAAVYAALRYFVPHKSRGEADSKPFGEEERRVYRRWESASGIPLLLFGVMLSLLWYWLLRVTGEFLILARGDALYILAPDGAYWAIPAMFLGLLTSAFPTALLYRALLRDRYARYTRYVDVKSGFDGWKVFRVISTIGFLGAALWLICGVNATTRITNDGIAVGRAFSFQPEHYLFSDIRELRHDSWAVAPNGRRVSRPHFTVRFENGREWHTGDGVRDPAPAEDLAVMQFISARTGLPIADGDDAGTD